MVVRVARQALLSDATNVVVAADHADIVAACQAHGITALLTRADHATGSDRLAECCELLGLNGADTVVNVQGDEPLIDPHLINACAAELQAHSDCVMSTVAHPIHSVDDFNNPNIVKVVLDAKGRALLFSRASIPCWRDAPNATSLSSPPPLRHVGIYAYRAGFLRAFPGMPISPLEVTESLEQLRVLWHGERIAVHVTQLAMAPGVDTPADLEKVRALCLAER
jgi:3-deoxy-manno-octulosonate cytidylyltransferase (CMP-KDO synthetase)